jgi:hypothetical protein
VHESANGDAAVFFEGAHRDELVHDDSSVAQQCRDNVLEMMALAVSGEEAQELLKAITSGQ